jgi:hypothetical protein
MSLQKPAGFFHAEHELFAHSDRNLLSSGFPKVRGLYSIFCLLFLPPFCNDVTTSATGLSLLGLDESFLRVTSLPLTDDSA